MFLKLSNLTHAHFWKAHVQRESQRYEHHNGSCSRRTAPCPRKRRPPAPCHGLRSTSSTAQDSRSAEVAGRDPRSTVQRSGPHQAAIFPPRPGSPASLPNRRSLAESARLPTPCGGRWRIRCELIADLTGTNSGGIRRSMPRPIAGRELYGIYAWSLRRLVAAMASPVTPISEQRRPRGPTSSGATSKSRPVGTVERPSPVPNAIPAWPTENRSACSSTAALSSAGGHLACWSGRRRTAPLRGTHVSKLRWVGFIRGNRPRHTVICGEQPGSVERDPRVGRSPIACPVPTGPALVSAWAASRNSALHSRSQLPGGGGIVGVVE